MRKLIVLSLLPLAACGCAPGDHDLAKAEIGEHCGACHTVPGVRTARGQVGPDLAGIGQQQVIAGKLPNSRPNMILWITHAQSVTPGSAMPDIPMSQKDAEAIADYLYSLD